MNFTTELFTTKILLTVIGRKGALGGLYIGEIPGVVGHCLCNSIIPETATLLSGRAEPPISKDGEL